jgi:hypothetical protein
VKRRKPKQSPRRRKRDHLLIRDRSMLPLLQIVADAVDTFIEERERAPCDRDICDVTRRSFRDRLVRKAVQS